MANNDPIDRIANRLAGIVQDGGQRLIANRAAKLDTELTKLQGQFFLGLATAAINVDTPPNLGIYTPKWKPLDEKYKRRSKKQGKGFYNFRGQLRQSLLRSKALTAFGRPLITVSGVGRYNRKAAYVVPSGGRNLGRTPTGGVVALGNIKNVLPRAIIIDLYPKVSEPIANGSLNEGEYFSEKIAVKMTNYKGGRDRPILVNYMNWWLDVKARQTVRKVLKV